MMLLEQLYNSEEELARLSISGNKNAFNELIKLLMPRLYKIASIIVRPNDVHDVVQDALTQAWKHVGEVRDPKALIGWIGTITSNQAKNLIRTRATQRRSSERTLQMGDDFDVPAKSLESGLEVDDIEMMHQAIAKLPERQQAILKMYLSLGGADHRGNRTSDVFQKLALAFNTNIGNARYFIHYIKALIREKMGISRRKSRNHGSKSSERHPSPATTPVDANFAP